MRRESTTVELFILYELIKKMKIRNQSYTINKETNEKKTEEEIKISKTHSKSIYDTLVNKVTSTLSYPSSSQVSRFLFALLNS
jgi:hypothetical protein